MRQREKETASFCDDSLPQQAKPECLYPRLSIGPGEHDLGEFKTGEQTPYWILTPVGRERRYTYKALNRKFKQVDKSGEEFCIWKEEDRNKLNSMHKTEDTAFKIVAVDNVGITLVIK